MDLNNSNISICRVCMCQNVLLKPIFIVENFSEEMLRVNEVMTTCASIQVEIDDGLPQEICTECLRRLREAYEFRNLCEQTDFTLRNNLVLIIKSESENVHQEHGNITSEQIYIRNEDVIDYQCEENVEVINFTENKQEEITKFYECDVCNQRYTTKQNWVKHIKIHSDVKPYICDLCGKGFNYNHGLYRHKKNIHGPEKLRECPVCHSHFSNKDLQLHLATHSGVEKSHRCNRCPKAFYKRSNLVRHLKTHKGNDASHRTDVQNLLRCNQCGMQFYSGWKLARHMMMHKGKKKTHGCVVCKKVFRDTHNLKRHMKTLAHLEQMNIADGCGMQNIVDESQEVTVAEEDLEQINIVKPDITEKIKKQEDFEVKHDDISSKEKEIQSKEKPYKCEICDKYFKTNATLSHHNKSHLNVKPYECDVCSQRYATKQNWEKHIKTHSDVKPFNCELCGSGFYYYNSLHKHRKNKHGFENLSECPVCHRHFSNEALELHLATHTEEEKSHQCKHCGKCFTKRSNLLRHMVKHPGVKTRTDLEHSNIAEASVIENIVIENLEVVDFTEKIREQLEFDEENTHDDLEQIKANQEVAEKIKKQDDFKNSEPNANVNALQLSIKSKAKSYKCEICGKVLKSRASLTRHNKLHLNIKPFKCDVCDQRYTTRQMWENHVKIHSDVKPYMCDKCGAGFNYYSTLHKHKKTMHGPKKLRECPVCQHFFNDEALVLHLTSHSEADRSHQCDHCGKCFYNRTKLARHLKTHTQHECNACRKSFVDKTALEEHRSVHSEADKPHRCNQCGMRFYQSWKLNRHLMTHTEDKMRDCGICNKRFRDPYYLRRHMKIHTGKNFQCDICAKIFTVNTALTKHKKQHSANELKSKN